MRVLLDMDEVLVDFVGGACSAWGTTKEQVIKYWTPGIWDMVPPLSRAIGQKEPMTQEEFWDRINGWKDFWVNLKPLPWIWEVLDLVRSVTEDWHIVSAPSRCVSSYDGKVRWLKMHLGSKFDRFCLTPHKEIFAGPGTILIDDRDSNLNKFRLAGGWGILFPAHQNRGHSYQDKAVDYVRYNLSYMQSLTKGASSDAALQVS